MCVRRGRGHLIMKHKLTIEQRLTGARKALAKLDRMGPRYRGLVAGIKKNIRNLEEYRARGLEFMPYKDRETYLRKQREFHARRKPVQKVLGLTATSR
jgi:hypothetical protein